MTDLSSHIIVRQLGRQPYEPVWQAMSDFTNEREEHTADEFWLVEHEPVFTQGQAGKAEHLLNTGDIPVVQVDRGGQVTYHGPGQQVVYFMINLRRKSLGVRELVSAIEEAVIDTLEAFGIKAMARTDAPGVYVESGAKICSLGLRIRKGCSFHGLALNVCLDLEPFLRINPCGYAGMEVTRICDQQGPGSLTEVEPALIKYLMENLGYNSAAQATGLP